LLGAEDEELDEWLKESAMERAGTKGLRRNLLVAAGNSAHGGLLAAVERWTDSEDPAIADAARWASARIRTRRAGR
jgi:epoxyqueuosine reductase